MTSLRLSLLQSLWAPEVALAQNGPEALRVATDFRPDAVLLDLALPGMSGYETARKLREVPEMRDVVLVALTGYGTGEDRDEAIAAGFNHHLVKPASADLLSVVLQKPSMSSTRGEAACEKPRSGYTGC